MSTAFNNSWYTDIEDVRDESLVPSPTYNLSSQVNSRRIGSAIPILHGLHKIVPDLASPPYTEALPARFGTHLIPATHAIFALSNSDVQIVGANKAEKRRNIFVGDSAVSNLFVQDSDFEESYNSSINKYNPSFTSSLVNPFIIPNTDVDNIGIDIAGPQGIATFFRIGVPYTRGLEGDWTAWYESNPNRQNTTTRKVQLNFFAPDGIHGNPSSSSPGLYNSAFYLLEVQVQREQADGSWVNEPNLSATIESDGGVIISYRNLADLTGYLIDTFSINPINFNLTFNWSVSQAGRFRFRVRNKARSRTTGDFHLNWLSMNTTLNQTPELAGGISYLAMRIPHSDRFEGISDLNNVSVIAQSRGRVINVSRPNSNIQTELARPVTSPANYDSPIDAIINILVDSLSWNISRIDLTTLKTIKQTLINRGDKYNAVLDSVSDAWTTIKNILKPYRCIPVIDSAGIFTIVRDDTRRNSSSLFTQRSMIKGSFSVKQNLAPNEVRDGVTLRFVDKDKNYETDDISVTATGGLPANPKTIRLRGITDVNQARREALYRARVNQYRRQHVEFSVEQEGLLLNKGDKVLVQNDFMKWGSAGDIIDVAYGEALIGGRFIANNVRLILSEPVEFVADPLHFYSMVFKTKDGGVTPVYSAIQVPTHQIDSNYETNQQVILTGNSQELVESQSGDEIIYKRSSRQTPLVTFFGFNGNTQLTEYAFGTGDNFAQEFVVDEITPSSETIIKLKLDNEDNRIYAD